MRALGSLLLPCADRGPGAGRRRRWRWTGTSSRRRCTRASPRTRTSRWCARKSPRCRRPGWWPPARSPRPGSPRPSSPGSGRRRWHSTMRSPPWSRPTRSITSGSMRSRGTARARATTTSTRRWTARRTTRFLDALLEADQHHGHDFDAVPYFEGCLPVEEMARRGRETLRFGPMKPVGLPDPRTGREPHAVVQLRREDRAGQMWNLVGFQTRLRIPEQQRVFRLIPGLEQAEFLRYGSIHRNSYLNSPASAGVRPHGARRRPALLRRPAHRGRGLHRVARHRAHGRASTSPAGSRAGRSPSRRPPPCSAACIGTCARPIRSTSSR